MPFLLFFKSILLLDHRAYLLGEKCTPFLGTQPHTEGHGLMRGVQLNISPKRISWVSTVWSPQLHVTVAGIRCSRSCVSSVCYITQSCSTPCDPMDCSLPGFSLCGTFQARILEWVAISFSRGSSQPRDWTWVSCLSCMGRWILGNTWEALCKLYGKIISVLVWHWGYVRILWKKTLCKNRPW